MIILHFQDICFLSLRIKYKGEGMIEVIYDYDNKLEKFEDKEMKVKDILKKMNIISNTVIVKVNDSVVTEEDVVKEGDKVEIIRIISGG